MTDLLPCPFCGGEADLIDMTGALEAEYWVAHQCPSGASFETYSYETATEAVEAWNTRAEMSYKNALILLDELGISERTCKFNIEDNMNETEGMGDVWIECSACHCVFDYYDDDWLMDMNYCPNCGAKVVDNG